MRGSWDHFSRTLARADGEPNSFPWWKRWSVHSHKYVERNLKHVKWFWCRNPIRVSHDLIWWVRHRTVNRYHIIETGLKPGWWDTDTRLLHAAFTLLENFVESEKPFKRTEYNVEDVDREFANEIHSLYIWWKHRKKIDIIYLNAIDEDRLYKEDTENLVRLMKIRATLWT
jgi:hypothetical protein